MARSVCAAALDLFVYGPLGAALELRSRVPQLAETGRAHVDTRIVTARGIGRFAVAQARQRAPGVLDGLRAEGHEVLVRNGLLPVPADRPPALPPPTTAPVVDLASVPAAAELPIAEYDSLSAVQVVPRLDGLTGDELDRVRRYESAHRGRRTILNRAAELGADPAP